MVVVFLIWCRIQVILGLLVVSAHLWCQLMYLDMQVLWRAGRGWELWDWTQVEEKAHKEWGREGTCLHKQGPVCSVWRHFQLVFCVSIPLAATTDNTHIHPILFHKNGIKSSSTANQSRFQNQYFWNTFITEMVTRTWGQGSYPHWCKFTAALTPASLPKSKGVKDLAPKG